MKYFKVKGSDQEFSQVALGTMRIVSKHVDVAGNKTYVGKPCEEVEALIKGAVEQGVNFIDTADIYGHGLSEKLIGEVIAKNPGLRDKMVLQTKCAVVSNSEGQNYNVSGEYIVSSVNESLKRLNTDHVDVLLLHKPDPLYDPAEIADAFDQLYSDGKVLNFGVSNFTSGQTALLEKYCRRPIAFSQMQFSIVHSLMIDSEINVNTTSDFAVDRDSGILDYCRLKEIRMQAYSVVQGENGTFINNPEYGELNRVMDTLCEKYGTNKNAIALAWILRHPAGIQPVIGTTKSEHVKDSLEALDITLTRQEWFDLYRAAGKPLP